MFASEKVLKRQSRMTTASPGVVCENCFMAAIQEDDDRRRRFVYFSCETGNCVFEFFGRTARCAFFFKIEH